MCLHLLTYLSFSISSPQTTINYKFLEGRDLVSSFMKLFRANYVQGTACKLCTISSMHSTDLEPQWIFSITLKLVWVCTNVLTLTRPGFSVFFNGTNTSMHAYHWIMQSFFVCLLAFVRLLNARQQEICIHELSKNKTAASLSYGGGGLWMKRSVCLHENLEQNFSKKKKTAF